MDTFPGWVWLVALLALLVIFTACQWLGAEMEAGEWRKRCIKFENLYWDLCGDPRLEEPLEDEPRREG